MKRERCETLLPFFFWLPGQWPIDVIGVIGRNGRQTADGLGREFDLQGKMPDMVGNGRAGDEFTDAPLFELERFKASAGFVLDVLDFHRMLEPDLFGGRLRPFP